LGSGLCGLGGLDLLPVAAAVFADDGVVPAPRHEVPVDEVARVAAEYDQIGGVEFQFRPPDLFGDVDGDDVMHLKVFGPPARLTEGLPTDGLGPNLGPPA
jgi:hypothetical protein